VYIFERTTIARYKTLKPITDAREVVKTYAAVHDAAKKFGILHYQYPTSQRNPFYTSSSRLFTKGDGMPSF